MFTVEDDASANSEERNDFVSYRCMIFQGKRGRVRKMVSRSSADELL